MKRIYLCRLVVWATWTALAVGVTFEPPACMAQSSSLLRREMAMSAAAQAPRFPGAQGTFSVPLAGQNAGLAAVVHQNGPPGLAGGGVNGPLMLPQVSMTYQALPPVRELRVHDLITIRVDEKSQTYSEGSVERRKTQNFDAMLQDWLILDGLRWVKPAPQSDGDQRIRGQANSIYRAEADLETRESLKFDITAEVVDIRPNGNLVLEAHRVLQNNEEVWEYSLTGICRKEDVLDGNLVLSKSIAELQLQKRERGAIRDAYRRGWLLRIWDEFRWF